VNHVASKKFTRILESSATRVYRWSTNQWATHASETAKRLAQSLQRNEVQEGVRNDKKRRNRSDLVPSSRLDPCCYAIATRERGRYLQSHALLVPAAAGRRWAVDGPRAGDADGSGTRRMCGGPRRRAAPAQINDAIVEGGFSGGGCRSTGGR
jgi:hypothetical protein